MCRNYSREETIQGQKLYEKIWYVCVCLLIIEKPTRLHIKEVRVTLLGKTLQVQKMTTVQKYLQLPAKSLFAF